MLQDRGNKHFREAQVYVVVVALKRHTMASFSFSYSDHHHPEQEQQLLSSSSERPPRSDNSNNNNNMSVENASWDLSNLYLNSKSSDDNNNHNQNSDHGPNVSTRRRNSSQADASLKEWFTSYSEPTERSNENRTQPLRRHSQQQESSLYPNQEDLLATSFAECCSVDDLFSTSGGNVHDNVDLLRSSSSSQQHEPPSLLRRNTSDPQLNQHFVPSAADAIDRSPGAFYSSASSLFMNHNTTNKPPKPSWVEKSTQLEQKIELQHRNTEPMMDGDDEEQYPNKTNTGCAGPTTLLSSSSSAKQSPRPEVEVSPGVYMALRGTDETIQAIETGRGKLVFCLACSTALQCVPDCDLVICPDCRVFSPVPKFVDDAVAERDAYSAAAAAAGSEEDIMMAGPTPPEWIGGVGLGLKVSLLY